MCPTRLFFAPLPLRDKAGKKLLLTVLTVMLQEHVDMVAGDFNGAAWRRQSGSDPRPISIIEEAFANTDLPVPPDPTPLCQVNCRTCADS